MRGKDYLTGYAHGLSMGLKLLEAGEDQPEAKFADLLYRVEKQLKTLRDQERIAKQLINTSRSVYDDMRGKVVTHYEGVQNDDC